MSLIYIDCRDAGIRIIGIGIDVDESDLSGPEDELLLVVSEPIADNLFMTENFDDALSKLSSDIFTTICYGKWYFFLTFIVSFIWNNY